MRCTVHSLVQFNKIIFSKNFSYLYNKVKFRYDSAMYERDPSATRTPNFIKKYLLNLTANSYRFRL